MAKDIFGNFALRGTFIVKMGERISRLGLRVSQARIDIVSMRPRARIDIASRRLLRRQWRWTCLEIALTFFTRIGQVDGPKSAQ